MNGLTTSPDKSGIAVLIGTGFCLVTLAGTALGTALWTMATMLG